MERANDSQSVKCSYCLLARADPLTPFDDPQARGHLSRGGQRAFSRTGCRGVAMVTALAGGWPDLVLGRRGVTVDVHSCRCDGSCLRWIPEMKYLNVIKGHVRSVHVTLFYPQYPVEECNNWCRGDVGYFESFLLLVLLWYWSAKLQDTYFSNLLLHLNIRYMMLHHLVVGYTTTVNRFFCFFILFYFIIAMFSALLKLQANCFNKDNNDSDYHQVE